MTITSLHVFCVLLMVHCVVIGPGVSGQLQCSGTLDLCQSYSIPSWRVSRVGSSDLDLSNCNDPQPQANDHLLLYVSHGGSNDYGKWTVVVVSQVQVIYGQRGSSVCRVSLSAVINSNVRVASQQRCLIAQKLPYFNDVHMDNECVLTCTGQQDGLGGILAFRARSLFMYGKIDMTGKGLRGGAGGLNAGAGGYGGETQSCPKVYGVGALACPTTCKAGNGGDAGKPGSGAGGGNEEYGPNDGSRLLMGEGGGGGGGGDSNSDYVSGGRGGNGGGLVFLQLDQLQISDSARILANGEQGQCYNHDYRSAAGGSGGGGSVQIFVNFVSGNLGDKISVSGGSPVKCGLPSSGGGGGGGDGQFNINFGSDVPHSQ